MADPVRVGPVVGEVTATTARIVVQPRRAVAVEVELAPDGGGTVVRASATAAKAGEVLAIAVGGLQADTKYRMRLSVDGVHAAGRSVRVVTKPVQPT